MTYIHHIHICMSYNVKYNKLEIINSSPILRDHTTNRDEGRHTTNTLPLLLSFLEEINRD